MAQLPAVWIKLYVIETHTHIHISCTSCTCGPHRNTHTHVHISYTQKVTIHTKSWSVCIMEYGSTAWWSVCRASARVGRAARTYSNHNEHQPLCPRETIDLVRGQGYDPSSTGFWGKRSSEGGNWCQVTAVSNPEASPPSLMTGAPPAGE